MHFTFGKHAMANRPFIDLRDARQLIRLKKYDEAKKLLLELQAEHPDDSYVAGGLVSVYLRTGEYDKAKQIIDQVLANHPDDYFFLSRKGDLLAAMHKYKRALTIFQQLYATKNDPHVGWRLAQVLVRQKRYDKAEYFIDQTIPQLFDKPELYYLGFQIKKALGKNDEAAKLLERAIHYSTDPSFYRSEQMKFKAETKGMAAKEWERSLRFSASKFDVNVQKQLAEKFIQEKKYEKAEKHLKEILKHDSSNMFIKNRLGYVYYKWQKYDLALALFLEMPLKNFLVPSFMQMVLTAARKTMQQKKVIAHLRTLLEKHPEATQLYGAIRTLEKSKA